MFHQAQLYSVQQQPVFIPGLYNAGGNRQPNFVQTVPVYPGPHFQYPLNPTQTPPQAAFPCKYYFFNQSFCVLNRYIRFRF